MPTHNELARACRLAERVARGRRYSMAVARNPAYPERSRRPYLVLSPMGLRVNDLSESAVVARYGPYANLKGT